ncbi:MAG: cysteine hydrolase [Chloroflexi bacterium]|nr:cysteine hydrolase [Chloroflexota bacterium]
MTQKPFVPALLIVDMQNDFVNPATRLYSPRAREIIPAINELARAARAQRAPVIWIVQEHRRQVVDFGREADISPVHCVEGTPGAALIDGLNRADDDFTVIKRRFSGFYATDLDLLLRCLSCNTLFLTGIASDGCVEATAIDAHARDYFVRVVSDATAGVSETAHEAALAAMSRLQPGVVIGAAVATKQLAGAT